MTDDELLPGFGFPPPTEGRAWVRANFVTSIDGAISVDGTSSALGSDGDIRIFRLLRDYADAILIGSGTAVAENYGSDGIPSPARTGRITRGQTPVAPVAVLTNSGRLPLTLPLFTEIGEVPPIVITGTAADQQNLTTLRERGVEVIVVPEQSVPVRRAIDVLGETGRPRILCEGGPHLLGSMLEDDALDDICVTTSPHLVAGQGGRMAASSADALRRMRRAALLTDQDGFLYARWVRDRSQR